MSQSEAIEARIKAQLAKMKERKPEAIRSETRFIEDLDMDSLDSFDLLFQLEEEFDIEISAVDLLHFCSVGDVIAYVQQRLGSIIRRPEQLVRTIGIVVKEFESDCQMPPLSLARVVYQTQGHSIQELIDACDMELEKLFGKREKRRVENA